MRVTKYSIAAIVSVLLVTGCVAYSIHVMFRTAEDPERILLEKHEKVTENASGLSVIATYGKIPEFENEEQKRSWYANIREIKNRVRSEMPPSYLDPEGPVMGYGHNREGYLIVLIIEDTAIEKPLMDEIYGIIDKQAREMSIQEVPVMFAFAVHYVPDGESPTE